MSIGHVNFHMDLYQNINETWRGDGMFANNGWRNKSDNNGISNNFSTKANRSSQLMS